MIDHEALARCAEVAVDLHVATEDRRRAALADGAQARISDGEHSGTPAAGREQTLASRGCRCKPHRRGILVVDVKETSHIKPGGDRLEGRPLSIGRDVNCGVAVENVLRRIKCDGKPASAAENTLRTHTCSVAALTLHASVSAIADHSDPVDARS
jgi:hypothetical protein